MRKLNGFLFSRQRVTPVTVRFKENARKSRCFVSLFELSQTRDASCVKSYTRLAMSAVAFLSAVALAKAESEGGR